MKHNSLNSKLPRRTWRAAAMLCAVLAGLGLARGAAAQGPQPPLSPTVPTPYQSSLFHAGGSDPALALPSPPFGVADLDPLNPLLLNPLYGQLQGTPTGLVPVTVTSPGGVTSTTLYPVQIPSFDLGAYDPTRAPGAGGPTGYYPDHLADGGVFSWQAPFNYVPLSVGMVVVDDASPAPTPATGATPATSGFALTPASGAWEQQTAGPAAGTATGGEYQRLIPNQNGAATWTLVATAAGSFSVYFHIPDQIADSNGVVEPRSRQVTYQIQTTGLNAQNATATVSQTEANSLQFLAGPFLLAVGDTVTVTLQRDASHNQNTNRDPIGASGSLVSDYLVADSMTLQTSIGDVRSTPTAINTSAYPADFARAKYWGIYTTPGTNGAPAVAGTTLAVNAVPDTTGGPTPNGTPLYFYGDPTKTKNDTGALDGPSVSGRSATPHKRLIRQLVYFGRQDATFSQGVTVDDSNRAPNGPGTSGFTSSGFSQTPDSTGTATNGEYRTATPATAGTGPTATWTLTAPNGGDYYVTVHLPATQDAQKRVPGPPAGPGIPYTVSVNGTPLVNQPVGGFRISQAQTGDVTLPTGTIPLNKGDAVTVTLTATGVTNAGAYTVVADSVRIATGGNGAIYCVDGFTGGVVWRFQTPGGLKGPSAPVFSSPVVTKINVLVTPAVGATPAVYANKLVVIVGDDNGMVYCLDAIGNGDGTSNANAIDPASGLPITIPQPAYGATPPIQVDVAGYVPHVGTTGAYWIYRPDPNRPKIVTGMGIGTVRRDSRRNPILDPNSDLPVPAAFGTASPNVFIDPSVSRTPDANTGALASNAKVYVGNSNGVLYALDALGVPIDGTSTDSYETSGDRFNAAYDLRRAPNVFPAVATDGIVPTPQPLWWFTLRGADPNSTDNPSNADIESAPAIYTTVTVTSVTVQGPPQTTTKTYTYAPTVYIGSAHEMEATSNVGRLYALNGTVGPSGNNGLTDPSAQPNPAQGGYTGPGSGNYNIGQRPQINNADAADWSFPDAYDRTTNNATKNNQGQSTNKLPRPALGNVTGSPVVFTNTNETNTARRTRIYFAANVGLEVPNGAAVGAAPSPRPDEIETGRLWAVNLDGSVGRTTNSTGTAGSTVWAYPLANDPNVAPTRATPQLPEPSLPLGAFLRATPAMGFVQFPQRIENGDGSAYAHADAVQNDVKTQSVPMLYVGTRGVNDTALYAIDVDGRTDDERLIYRQISPDGSIFQSSPALIANTSTVGGNGGAVYAVAGNTLYDFSATPISNPIAGQAFPLIRENKAYTGFGPLSSPTVSAASTFDLLTLTPPTTFPYPDTETDWIYVGDSSTGFCRGITPFDTTDIGIPGGLGGIVPPTAEPPGTVDLQAIMQVYLVDTAHSDSVSAADGLAVGPTAPLPVYDWGQDVYIRFKNVVPPPDPGTDRSKDKIVVDPTAPTPGGVVQGYGNGGPIEFDISDSTDGTPADHGTVPAVFLPAANKPLGNGFIARRDADPAPTATTNGYLEDTATNKGYIGAYTYAISDGTARRNTPGSRRHVINAKQTVHIYTSTSGQAFVDTGRTAVIAVQTTNGNAVSVPITNASGVVTGYGPLKPVFPVDEPTFGILNPLAVRGGGIPLQLGGTTTAAVEIGDAVGPFRGIASPITNSPFDLEGLANGNNILQSAPNSSSGGGGTIRTSPIRRNTAETNPPTTRHVVVTSTGLISHNTSGDNFDAPVSGSTLPLLPPQGTPGTTGEGISPGTNFGSQSAPFAADVADRSALGLRQKRLRVKTGTISGGGAGLYWNDNSTNVSGHDSVVNFLPWESAPVGYKVGTNSSTDYPNLGPSEISATLYRPSAGSADLTLGNSIAEPATGTIATDPGSRVISTNPVQFHISVPHFQPANQQLYRQEPRGGYVADQFHEIAPLANTFGPSDNVFPMGYVTTRRIYIPDQGGFYRPGAAFRDIRVYTGVPPDYGIQMADPTVTIPQTVPSGFGIQTSQFTPLTGAYPTTGAANPPGTFDPYRTFSPYNPAFQDYFQPLTIHNTGNVNLLNVHLDQKQQRPINGTPTLVPLPLTSDALDSLSSIPGYDYGGMTGPRLGKFGANNVPEDSYLIRSSLDGDLVAGFGHNPYIVLDPNGVSHLNVYPGATFHKAQVGSGQPSTLFLPDAPEGFTPGASLDVPPTNHPTQQGDTSNLDANGNPLPFKTAPFVSVAVPFGTPVGSYHGNLQLFEGLDGDNYPGVVTNTPGGATTYTGLTAQIFPPQYNGRIGGIGAPGPGPGPNGLPLDTIRIVRSTNNVRISLMPNSSNATVLNVKVGEDRMTDGSTFGVVPMIDALGGGRDAKGNPISLPDFAPAAFRDPNSGNLSVYWTSGRVNPGYGIFSATVPMLSGAFMPVDPSAPGTVTAPNYVNEWWTSLGNASTGYNAGVLKPAIPTNMGTNSGLTIAQDSQNLSTIGAFAVNVQAPPLPGVSSYQNTLLYYPVTPGTGALVTLPLPQRVVTNDPTQVKYGVKGLIMDASVTKFTRNLWAFWTATTRGRTAIYYNSTDPANNNIWIPTTGPSTIGLLPIPAGLTAVADPAPLLVYGNIANAATPLQATIEVTYSGTAPDGSVDLYGSRYQPDKNKPALLDLVPFPAVTEVLKATGQPGGWYQARDVAWSRTSRLNLSMQYVNNGATVVQPLLYDTANNNAPLFSRAVFDKASGLLVLTGVKNPTLSGTPTGYAFGRTSAPVTIYIDLATGRARFSATPNPSATVTAFFSPLARRMTDDSRADTAPITFLDGTLKANTAGNPVKADRRWYIWRKSGAGGAASPASIYYKTQRLTAFLRDTIDLSKSFSLTLNGTAYSGPVDAYNVPAVFNANGSLKVPASARLFFPIQSGAEGAAFTITYTNLAGASRTDPANADTVQWQDEIRSNDTVRPNDTTAPPTDATTGLAAINPGYLVPLDTTVNENNVSAFLDTEAYSNSLSPLDLSHPHKVWLFWNSTRNGTADLYYETINPLFGAGP